MDLSSLITILELTNTCKIKARALISDNQFLDEDTLERACYYYIALKTTSTIAREAVDNISKSTESVEDNIDLLASLFLGISKCSEMEALLGERVNILSH